MTMRMRTMMGLALAGVLASATATLARKGDAGPPPGPVREAGPFVQAGRYIINASRVDFIEVQNLENGDRMLTVYLMGRTNPAPRIRAGDAAELLRTLGVPPLDPAKTEP